VSLAVAAGESVALLGPSGCGKTSTLNLVGLLDRPTRGTISIGGTDPWKLGSTRRAAMRLEHIGFVFQSANLIPHLSALDNVALPAWKRGRSRRAALTRAAELLEQLGLEYRSGGDAVELSPGEAQRVAIARAVINDPSIILADEPTGSLDSASAEPVLSLLTQVCDRGGALLLVTHDEAIAARLDRQLRMRDGSLG